MPTFRRHRTVLAIATVAAAVLTLLWLEMAGLASFSLGGNAIYNPMPGYGPLRLPMTSLSTSSPSTANTPFIGTPSSSASPRRASARSERRQRLLQRPADGLR